MLLTFPNFNIFSTPLLILVLQGLIFGILLIGRYRKNHRLSDVFLASLVIITCYHRTTYTIGFMDWYDTYRNTKINYGLIALTLAIGPLIYLYIKSITETKFQFKKSYWWHFLPAFIYVVYRIFIFVYDFRQPGFDDEQNGVLMKKWANGAVGDFFTLLNVLQQLLYLAFSFQIFYAYRKRIKDIFSNTYRLELHWLRNFLYIYSFLFLYGVIQQFVQISLFELSWIDRWWYQFFSALAVIYIGIKGYFTDTSTLANLNLTFEEARTVSFAGMDRNQPIAKKSYTLENSVHAKEHLKKHMAEQRPYLNPELNLIELSKDLQMGRAELSELINSGFQKNFNDFINAYRVEAVIDALKNRKQDKLSLLGIAYENGFNSKATFNRVFKRLTGVSPSEYINKLQ